MVDYNYYLYSIFERLDIDGVEIPAMELTFIDGNTFTAEFVQYADEQVLLSDIEREHTFPFFMANEEDAATIATIVMDKLAEEGFIINDEPYEAEAEAES